MRLRYKKQLDLCTFAHSLGWRKSEDLLWRHSCQAVESLAWHGAGIAGCCMQWANPSGQQDSRTLSDTQDPRDKYLWVTTCYIKVDKQPSFPDDTYYRGTLAL